MKKQRLILILSFLLLVFHVHADDLDDFIRSQMQKRGIPGLSLAIIQLKSNLSEANDAGNGNLNI